MPKIKIQNKDYAFELDTDRLLEYAQKAISKTVEHKAEIETEKVYKKVLGDVKKYISVLDQELSTKVANIKPIKGEKGEKGEDGSNGKDGVFTDEHLDKAVKQSVDVVMGKVADLLALDTKGEKIEYLEVRKETREIVLKYLNETLDAKTLRDKVINAGVDYSDIKNAPDIEKAVRIASSASKTVRSDELEDAKRIYGMVGAVLTRDENGVVTRVDYDNGDYTIINRAGNEIQTLDVKRGIIEVTKTIARTGGLVSRISVN